MATAEKKSYRDTLNLPKTEFPMRAGASETEPRLLERWQQAKLYAASLKAAEGQQKFVYHDGPPYANGHIHLGHAFGKVLRDAVCKSERMEGRLVYFVPGWDCHGLPIELKVIERNSGKVLDAVALKKACREYAKDWIETQRGEFLRLGILADWENPYVTMAPTYEADILQAFAEFVQQGFIERRERTVPWCASCKTTLAAAEIEYKDREDPSCYVLFDVPAERGIKLFPQLYADGMDFDLSFLVWTTTPWTLPLNRALLINADADYVVIKKDKRSAFILEKHLAPAVCARAGVRFEVLATVKATELGTLQVFHPTEEGRQVPVLLDKAVSLEDGTAVVHTAPGCGPEDYLVGMREGLEIFSPISENGHYTEGIVPANLIGLSVADGQKWVLDFLTKNGRLLHKATIMHSYPCCWRCRKGLIFRATKQWFCNLGQHDLIQRTLKETEKINFFPAWGKARLQAFVATRTEWCISRQRIWGVPIPALRCAACSDSVYMTTELVRNVAAHVAQEGIEYWDRADLEQLKKDGVLPVDLACPHCKGTAWVQERDILDVWFDSGISHYAVLAKDKNQGIPADLYLEGSDQHRGWFQSSLFTAMILYGRAPMKSILTHGFIVDENRHKMSKSLGNVISPFEIIDKYGADVLRLWAASADYERDTAISDQIMTTVAEVYRKIRNTCRFMISNLYDFGGEETGETPSATYDWLKKFDVDGMAVSFPGRDGESIEVRISAIDRMILGRLLSLSRDVRQAYRDRIFTTVYHRLNTFCTNDLSAEYLDIVKDRLYVEPANSALRRSTQMSLYLVLDTMTHLMAPILSFLAEEVSDFYQINKVESVHLQPFFDEELLETIIKSWDKKFVRGIEDATVGDVAKLWQMLDQVRAEVLKAIEVKRELGTIKHSLESSIALFIDKSHPEGLQLRHLLHGFDACEGMERFLKDWLIVSDVELMDSDAVLQKTGLSWLYIGVKHAPGTKCPRCWHWEEISHADGLCRRCAAGE